MKRVAVVGLVAVAVVSGWVARDASAAGPPTTNPLVFRGLLTDGNGVVNGDQSIVVRLFAGNVAQCASNATPATTVTNGRFAVTLPDACRVAIEANPDLTAEVTVGSTTLPRTPVTTVPFAIEAKNALNATAALGDLRTELNALAPRSAVPILTDWATYTPALTYRDSGLPVDGQPTVTGQWRREGDSVRLRIHVQFGGSVTGNGQFQFNLPNGKVPRDYTSSSLGGYIGTGVVGRPGFTSTPLQFGTVYNALAGNHLGGGLDRTTGPGAHAGTYIIFEVLVAVEGWTTTTGATT